MKVSFMYEHHPYVLSYAVIDACIDLIHSVEFCDRQARVEVAEFPEFLRAVHRAYANLSRGSEGWAVRLPLHVLVSVGGQDYKVRVYVDRDLKGIRYGSEC